MADTPFEPGRPISGFRTGPLGMGHAVLHTEDPEALLPFYRDLLGFRVSDFGRMPFPLHFFHLNGRHHSFAMVGSRKQGLHHFMVELGMLDDVGQGYDLAGVEEGRVAYTLGRHTNDHMTSFYANTPSGFFVEYGWGGRVIDPDTWTPQESARRPEPLGPRTPAPAAGAAGADAGDPPRRRRPRPARAHPGDGGLPLARRGHRPGVTAAPVSNRRGACMRRSAVHPRPPRSGRR